MGRQSWSPGNKTPKSFLVRMVKMTTNRKQTYIFFALFDHLYFEVLLFVFG